MILTSLLNRLLFQVLQVCGSNSIRGLLVLIYASVYADTLVCWVGSAVAPEIALGKAYNESVE